MVGRCDATFWGHGTRDVDGAPGEFFVGGPLCKRVCDEAGTAVKPFRGSEMCIRVDLVDLLCSGVGIA